MELIRNFSAGANLLSVCLLLYGFFQVCRTMAATPGIIAPVSFADVQGWKVPLILIYDVIVIAYDFIRICFYGPALLAVVLFIADCYITYLGMNAGKELLGVMVGGGISAILGIIASIVLRNMQFFLKNKSAKQTGIGEWLKS